MLLKIILKGWVQRLCSKQRKRFCISRNLCPHFYFQNNRS